MTDTSPTKGLAPKPPARATVAATTLAVALAAMAFASTMLLLIPASHDELHFCHAAWLAQQGLRPYEDFLYHNSPGILYLLRTYAVWNPDFGAEIIVWGRILCVASLWLTAFLLFRLGTLVHSRRVGLLSIVFVIPLLVVPYNSDTFRKQHWSVRPEVLVMPLAFAALVGTLRLLKASEDRGSQENDANGSQEIRGPAATLRDLASRATFAVDHRQQFWLGFLAFSSAGLALFFSPRVVFLCLGLALLVLLE